MKLKTLIAYLWDQEDLHVDIAPDHNFEIENAQSLDKANEFDLTFCKYISVTRAQQVIDATKSRIILIFTDLYDALDEGDKCLLPVPNPRLTYMRIVEEKFIDKPTPKISKTAVIPASCDIGSGVSIGEYVVLGERVQIGNNTIIHHGVAINDGVHVGKDCIIYPNTVIGWDGFSYEYDEKYNYQPVKFPHRGNVVIGDRVEIGSNVSIDRGSINNTLIGHDVKIDNLCHIAHNVVIGRSSFIIALSLIAGSVELDHHVWVAPAVTVQNGIKIGARSMLGTGAVVVRDVEPDTTVAGVPAKPMKRHSGSIPLGYDDQ